jgi:hypothetical protein
MAVHQQVADLFVMCPDCGVRAKLSRNQTKFVNGDAKCEHRQNPVKCPTLVPLIEALLGRGRRR